MNRLVCVLIVAVVLLVMLRAMGYIGNNVIETMAPKMFIMDAADAAVVTMEWFEPPVSYIGNTGMIEIEPYMHHETHTGEPSMMESSLYIYPTQSEGAK